MSIRSNGLAHSFRKKLQPFERLGLSVQNYSPSVRTAKCHPFGRLGLSLQNYCFPFELPCTTSHMHIRRVRILKSFESKPKFKNNNKSITNYERERFCFDAPRMRHRRFIKLLYSNLHKCHITARARKTDCSQSRKIKISF